MECLIPKRMEQCTMEIKDKPIDYPHSYSMVKFISMIEITIPRPASNDPNIIAMNDNGQMSAWTFACLLKKYCKLLSKCYKVLLHKLLRCTMQLFQLQCSGWCVFHQGSNQIDNLINSSVYFIGGFWINPNIFPLNKWFRPHATAWYRSKDHRCIHNLSLCLLYWVENQLGKYTVNKMGLHLHMGD